MNKEQVEQMLKEGKSLVEADLRGADLSGAYFRWVDFRWADLTGADLTKTNLTKANFTGADLTGADLTGAVLRGAYLTEADLTKANFTGADLTGAHLTGADLTGADLTKATLPDFGVCPEEGEFTAWKKTTKGIIRLLIPANAKRLNAIGSRKCRASKVIVLDGPGCGGSSPTYTKETLVYAEGAEVVAPEFSDDIRAECAPGIHFFVTKKEAEEW